MFITYPPIVDSSIPAFSLKEPFIRIYFEVPKTVNIAEVKNVAVRIAGQSNNKSVIDAEKYWDGIIYTDYQQEGEKYFVVIDSKDISIPNNSGFSTWIPNFYYKIQIRFSYDQPYKESFLNNKADFFRWKKSQSTLQNFSEWSNVIIAKVIYEPVVKILNNAEGVDIQTDVLLGLNENVERTIFPRFDGAYSNDKSEPLDKYQFILYSGLGVNEDHKIADSGWLQCDIHGGVLNFIEGRQTVTSLVSHNFQYALEEDKVYTLAFNTISMNMYKASAEPYTFKVVTDSLDEIKGLKLKVEDSHGKDANPYCNENGCFNISIERLNKKDPATGHYVSGVLNGIYYLCRTDQRSNYTQWEDLARFTFFDNSGIPIEEDALVYQDFTIESGVRYLYCLEYSNPNNLRSPPLFENDEQNDMPSSYEDAKLHHTHYCDFQYAYFYHNGIQVKFSYDTKIQSFKKSRLAVKQDTLNSKYPLILRNGLADYGEFNLSGKISILNDEDETFLWKTDNGYKFEDDLVIPAERYMGDYKRSATYENTLSDMPANGGENLIRDVKHFSNAGLVGWTDDNIFIEKKYRDLVYSFLNNGDYKLFKSATEGNFIVNLINVTMTPEEKLGRRIYNFSATVYEVMDCTLKNMQEYKINELDNFYRFNKVKEQNDFRQYSSIATIVGQLRGAFTGYHERYRNPESLNPKKMKYPSNGYEEHLNNGRQEDDTTQYHYFDQDTLSGFSYLSKVTFGETNPYLPEVLANPDKYYFDNRDNLYELIKLQCNKRISDDYKYSLYRIKSFWVEVYPEIDLKGAHLTHDMEKPDPKYIYPYQHWQEEGVKLDKLEKELQLPQSNLITLVIDGTQEINVFPNRLYSLEDYDIKKSLYLKTTRAVVINYIADVIQSENKEDVVQASRIVYPWGQISGVFTTSKEIFEVKDWGYLMTKWVGDGGTVHDPYFVHLESERTKYINGDLVLKDQEASTLEIKLMLEWASKVGKVPETDADRKTWPEENQSLSAQKLCSDVYNKEGLGYLKGNIENVYSGSYEGLSPLVDFSSYDVENPENHPVHDPNSEEILDNYDYDRNLTLYAVAENDTGINGHPKYNYNLYQSTNLYDIIRQKSRLEIEKGYYLAQGKNIPYEKLRDYFYSSDYNNNEQLPWSNKDPELNSSYIEYSFEDIAYLEIEADEGTELTMTIDYNIERKIRIGPTGKYVLSNFNDTKITGLSFTKPTHAIINYRARCFLRVKGED